MTVTSGPIYLNLGPRGRGAPDSLRDCLREITAQPAHFLIASQQLSDPEFITDLVRSTEGLRGKTRAFVERKYYFESKPTPAENIWHPDGKNETNRRALLALFRGGVDIRTDFVSSALQHANFVLASPADENVAPRALFTSANLTQNSVDRHLNWSALIDDPVMPSVLRNLFDTTRDADFTDSRTLVAFDEGKGQLCAGAEGQVLDDIVDLIRTAEARLHFAYFNISVAGALVEELLAAAARGCQIRGIVDGDQGHQSWNPLPAMQEAGIDARYYPGQMTGAPGRMHYKMLVCDDDVVHLGTANLSLAAERSLELGLSLRGRPSLANYVRDEIEKLYDRSRHNPPPLLPT